MLYIGTRAVCPTIVVEKKQTGRYRLLQRIKDDSNNEIGTVAGFFSDSNTEYAIICLDAQYRNDSLAWCSSGSGSAFTNMDIYNNSVSSYWYNEKKTATDNTQAILDFAASKSWTSPACNACRALSFIIEGTTYYGQLPNMREVFEIWANRSDIESADTTAGSYSSLNFSTARRIWSSTQAQSLGAWFLSTVGGVSSIVRNNTYFVAPILELPN